MVIWVDACDGPTAPSAVWEHQPVTGTRSILCFLVFALPLAPLQAGNLFPPRKPKLDANRIRVLNDLLRTEVDEKKRRAAIAELKEADPRAYPEATLALVGALQRDPSTAVRREAAQAIGEMKVMVPVAGVALELAAESDRSPEVRDAAQQSLWEYHLIGYRSAKGSDGIAGQTAEPPRARPATPRPYVVMREPVVPPAPPVQVKAIAPAPTKPISRKPVNVGQKNGIRLIVSAAPPAQLNATGEPPLAYPRTPPAILDSSLTGVTLPSVSLAPDVQIGPLHTSPWDWTPPRVLPQSRRISLPTAARIFEAP